MELDFFHIGLTNDQCKALKDLTSDYCDQLLYLVSIIIFEVIFYILWIVQIFFCTNIGRYFIWPEIKILKVQCTAKK